MADEGPLPEDAEDPAPDPLAAEDALEAGEPAEVPAETTEEVEELETGAPALDGTADDGGSTPVEDDGPNTADAALDAPPSDVAVPDSDVPFPDEE